ncbi:MAG: C40 family peptidase [Fibrobacter sp.]|nr:C40 family peptidase [Fibrobacter sp.]
MACPKNILRKAPFLQHHGLLRVFFAIFLSVFFAGGLLCSCTFPVRTGYDRKIGDYKRVSSATATAKVDGQVAAKPQSVPSQKTQSEKKQNQQAPQRSVVEAPKAKPTPSKKRSSLKEYTESWRGTKYVYGGSSKSGTDCSGYIMNVYRDVYGVSLPHKASMIYSDERFTKVSRGDLKEGDLVFFGDFWGISHIGVYLGDDTFSHASTSRGVVTDKLSAKYYESRYQGARRLKK